jgi:hypothetical protein
MSSPTVKLTLAVTDTDFYDSIKYNYFGFFPEVEQKNDEMFTANKFFTIEQTMTGPIRQVIKTYDSTESANEFLNFIDNLLEKYEIPLVFSIRSIEPL